MEQKVIIQYAN